MTPRVGNVPEAVSENSVILSSENLNAEELFDGD